MLCISFKKGATKTDQSAKIYSAVNLLCVVFFSIPVIVIDKEEIIFFKLHLQYIFCLCDMKM